MGWQLCLETNEHRPDFRKRSLKAMREAFQEVAGLGARLGESATATKNTPVARSTMAGPGGRANWNDSRTPATETRTPIATAKHITRRRRRGRCQRRASSARVLPPAR